MQSRRHEFRDRRTDVDLDPFGMPRRDVLERSPRSRRSLSPRRRIEGSRREFGGNRRSISGERRDYGGQEHKRPHYDEGITARDFPSHEMRGRYDLYDFVDKNADLNAASKHEYEYEPGTSRDVRDKDHGGSRLYDTGGNVMLGHKSLVSEENSARRPFRFPGDDVGVGPTLKYFEGGGGSFSSSANLDLGHFKDDRGRYPDPLLLDRLPVTESGKGEKYMFSRPGDVSYSSLSATQSKDFMGAYQFKDLIGTSSGISRANLQDGMDEHMRSSAKFTESLVFSGYGHRPGFDSGRDPEGERRDLVRYPRDTFSPTRDDREVYLYPRPGGREIDDYGYPYEQSQKRMSSEYDDDRDLIRRYLFDPDAKPVENIESSRRNVRDSRLWDIPPMQNQTFSDYRGVGKSSTLSKQGGEYLESGSFEGEFGRRLSREREMPHMGVSRDLDISHSRSDYGFGRDADPASHKERMRGSPEFKHEAEMHRVSARTHGMKPDELDAYDISDRVHKRKFIMDEDMSWHNSKSTVSSRLDYSIRTRDRDSRSGEWIEQDVGGSFSSKRLGYINNNSKRKNRTFDVADCHKVSASEDWRSSLDLEEHVQERYTKHYKPSSRHLNGHPRPGSSNWQSKFHWNRKEGLPRPNNVWIRGKDDNDVGTHANKVDLLRTSVHTVKSEPQEDSEEFKQLVHGAFLTFTKKLNENPAVRRRYKEQGRAGSLFCIVCGKSLSKDFMDTKSLAAHAYMSHKVGLRSQHFGLHKAICVLLGWKSTVAPDVTTWAPETISSAEALAQKEDLILWPPVVVIRNSSISDSDPKENKPVTVEALGDFLRGKGFSGGKYKICLGRAPNHRILLVKFTGTFSGLRDAEKLHKYFADNKHGRTDFDSIVFGKGKSRKSGEGGIHGDIIDDNVLFGYMGIAEDLDKVDFDTNRKCTIKSKMEIQDIANAPVKPE